MRNTIRETSRIIRAIATKDIADALKNRNILTAVVMVIFLMWTNVVHWGLAVLETNPLVLALVVWQVRRLLV